MSRKRRHYRGLSLGDFSGALDESVKPMHVLGGAVLGLVGIAGAKWGKGKLDEMLTAQNIALPDIVGDLVPLVGASAVGAAAYALTKKHNSQMAAGLMAGAIAGGAAITAAGLAAKHGVPGFGDVVSVNLKGLVTRQFNGGPRMGRAALGLVTGDPRRQAMGLITANARPSNSQKLGLITANRRSALGRPSGGLSSVREFHVP